MDYAKITYKLGNEYRFILGPIAIVEGRVRKLRAEGVTEINIEYLPDRRSRGRR